jgi:CheY-like chemotaxis protein
MQNLMNNATILVVDDNPTNVKLVCNILKKEGFNLAVAMNGQDALEIVESNPIDIILLDIMMPGMDGYEVCGKLKESESYRDIPVIFISALNDMDDITKSYDLGGVDFISKPVKEREVISRVRTQLELVSARKMLCDSQHVITDDPNECCESDNKTENFMKNLLPGEDEFKKHFADCFILKQTGTNMPPGFYWLCNHDDYVLLVLADSCISEIPGISFNVIGLTLLNQLPLNNFTDQANDIMEQLLPSYLDTLNAFGFKNLTAGDISIGVLAWNKKNRMIHYAGNRQMCFAFQHNDHIYSDTYTSGIQSDRWELKSDKGLRLYLLSCGLRNFNHDGMNLNGAEGIIDKIKKLQPQKLQDQKTYLKKHLASDKSEQDKKPDLTLIGIELDDKSGNHD